MRKAAANGSGRNSSANPTKGGTLKGDAAKNPAAVAGITSGAKPAPEPVQMDAAELDKLWAMFEESPAPMTPDDVDEATRVFFGDGPLRGFRCVMFMMTRTGRELIELARNPDMVDALKELKEYAEDRAERFRAAADTFDDAGLRLGLALCDAEPGDGAVTEGGAA